MAQFERTVRSTQHRDHREDEPNAAAQLFPGTRAQAVAEARADIEAGRVYDAASVERWMAGWDTVDETDLPPANWRNSSRHKSGSGL